MDVIVAVSLITVVAVLVVVLPAALHYIYLQVSKRRCHFGFDKNASKCFVFLFISNKSLLVMEVILLHQLFL